MSRQINLPKPADIGYGWEPGGQLYEDVHRERIRAHAKHDDNGNSMERKDWWSPDWLPVLIEEVGEVARVQCEYRHGKFGYQGAKDSLREELVQVAAMTCAWIDAIDLDEL